MQRYYPAEICRFRDLSKRWYIYYYHLIPGTTQYKFFKEYAGINRYKSKKQRLEAAKALRDARNELLAEGWSPFKEHSLEEFIDTPVTSISKAFADVIHYKKSYLKYTGYKSAKSRINAFLQYCQHKKLLDTPVSDIDQKFIQQYLNTLKFQRSLSNRARNNHLIELRSSFEILRKNQHVASNPAEFVDKLPEQSEIHRPFTDAQLVELKNYLSKHDPYLLQFCYFVIYAFLRTTEIVNLKINDLDLDSDLIHVRSKTGFITKPLLSQLRAKLDVMNVEQYEPNCYLFSAKGHPNPEGTTREMFSHRFTKAKRALGYSKFYTLYGLRHTFVQQLLNNGASDRQVMALTGHRTMAAFEAYKRNLNIKQVTGQDLSGYFNDLF